VRTYTIYRIWRRYWIFW